MCSGATLAGTTSRVAAARHPPAAAASTRRAGGRDAIAPNTRRKQGASVSASYAYREEIAQEIGDGQRQRHPDHLENITGPAVSGQHARGRLGQQRLGQRGSRRRHRQLLGPRPGPGMIDLRCGTATGDGTDSSLGGFANVGRIELAATSAPPRRLQTQRPRRLCSDAIPRQTPAPAHLRRRDPAHDDMFSGTRRRCDRRRRRNDTADYSAIEWCGDRGKLRQTIGRQSTGPRGTDTLEPGKNRRAAARRFALWRQVTRT